MIRGYGTAREHLADVIELAETMFEWRRAAPLAETDEQLRRAGELEFEIAHQEDVIAARVAATSPRLPFDLACDRFELSDTERRVLSLLVAFEVTTSEHRPAPTVGLVDALIYRTNAVREVSVVELARDSRLFAVGLAELSPSRDVPWLATPVRTFPRVVELAFGRRRLDLDVARHATLIEEPRTAEHLLVPDEVRAMVTDSIRSQAAARDASTPIPFLVGNEGSGRATLVHGAARSLAAAVLEVHARTLPRGAELEGVLRAIEREAMLFNALLFVRDLQVLSGDEGRAIPDLIPTVVDVLGRHSGPIAVSATRACWPNAARRAALEIEVPIPTEAVRTELFARALATQHDLAEQAAARYRVTGGLIERASATARSRAAARGGAMELDDLRVAIRGLLDGELSLLGRRVEWKQTWDDIVLPRDVQDELRELISRARHRKRVLDEWGFARKVGKGTGMSALFSGPPGTGKTMVAGLLASELGLDLYQIDSSRLVSKWIGETEKNLARLFDAAGAGHAILLFDEADSLFAKRTEVKSSNDRYANLEVNYLLQRMEAFDGISILTTNLETSVDEAFRRRLAFRISFPLPEVDERERLWHAMLPAQAKVAANLDFRSLAQRYEMSGGYIRNAVLRAAYLAAADNSVITQNHLQRAATLEYTAMGKIVHHGSSLL